MDYMKTPSERKSATIQPPPITTTRTKAMPRRSQIRKADAPRFSRPQAANPQNAQRNYERYLALARAEALSGDRIAAENYFQHAEHYFRSMHEKSN